ncbi:disease resistance protein Pik-2-like [Lolium rigidum]|uniref:disease resistance protein Pik-2-like n=1 Tax=Lolium rigidum TaxID=89674 RepID=UPI001F5C0F37|nr:disease resistance protein Pik-2-like [Lolium rigidum]XP_051183766.1 disease resistance protein Pik-2-like [Lolium perenne]
MILKKCDGLPLAIVTIGGFLANQPKTVLEWRKLNEHISAELEMNPELEIIIAVLNKSYDGLPYHLKSCFLYMAIFPEGYKASRRRLVRRWTAEGYSREGRGKSAEEIADNYFMELISRSMILPYQQSIHSRKGIDSCQVHDLIREIGISKSTEGNLVFRLEKDCSLNGKGKIHHLSISINWEGDQVEFESIVDMSRIRSLTVFGKWRPFFISDKMRLLRVLDLEGTSGVVDHHLEYIGKLLHIRYLSIRGCKDIYHLPDSLGNLRQLQTLDITGTCIIGLPQTIVKLSKLQNICGGAIEDNDDDNLEIETCQKDLPKVMRNMLCVMTCSSMAFCVACCAPQFVKEKMDMDMDVDVNRRDVCTMCCCNILPLLATRQSPRGIAVPRGIRRLKALQKLGIVNIRRAKAVLQDLKELNQLRKLGVIGVNKRNSRDLFSAVANLSCLELLLVQSLGYPGLSGCLDDVSSPPANLQSLKLYGNIVKLPKWIQGLTNLVKLRLRSSRIVEHDAAIQLLGKIPNLATLRLWKESFVGKEVSFNFRRGAFPNLVVLELDRLGNLQSVKFEEGATPKLELLQFRDWTSEASTGLFIGLPSLPSLKEFMLMEFHNGYKDEFVEELWAELAKNLNRAVLKRY